MSVRTIVSPTRELQLENERLNRENLILRRDNERMRDEIARAMAADPIASAVDAVVGIRSSATTRRASIPGRQAPAATTSSRAPIQPIGTDDHRGDVVPELERIADESTGNAVARTAARLRGQPAPTPVTPALARRTGPISVRAGDRPITRPQPVRQPSAPTRAPLALPAPRQETPIPDRDQPPLDDASERFALLELD